MQKLYELCLKDGFGNVGSMAFRAMVIGIFSAIAARPAAGKFTATLGASCRNAERKIRIEHPLGMAGVVGIRSQVKLDFIEKFDRDDRLKTAFYFFVLIIKASGIEFGAEDFVDCLLADRLIASLCAHTPRVCHAR
ncbi:MAG: hypothetical protein HYV42_00450 [Candidatus Magasanikbacteria bacterium]|nr:hypothetical protein [Candidatus Magasanikbacteria bacterium]